MIRSSFLSHSDSESTSTSTLRLVWFSGACLCDDQHRPSSTSSLLPSHTLILLQVFWFSRSLARLRRDNQLIIDLALPLIEVLSESYINTTPKCSGFPDHIFLPRGALVSKSTSSFFFRLPYFLIVILLRKFLHNW